MKSANYAIEYLEPFGIVIRTTENVNLQSINTNMLKAALNAHKLILIRNTVAPDQQQLIDFANSIGPLLKWDFGSVMEMRVHTEPQNYLFTNGRVPFHWDGAFHQSPKYLLFHCIEAPLAAAGGETLFTNTPAIWQDADEEEKAAWRDHTLTYSTEKLAHYGGTINIKLVQTHPTTQEIILRFAEPVHPPMLNPVSVTVAGLNDQSSRQLIHDIAQRCYDQRYCYQHQWQPNDILLADNQALIHGRHAFQAFSPRHLRRIQIL